MMHALLRKVWGVLGVGVTWGVGFAIALFITGSIIGVLDPDSIDPGEAPWRIGMSGGLIGFVSGAGCALILSLIEARRTLRDLSLWRTALWGFLGASALPLLTTANDSRVFIMGPLGAALATGSVAIARRAELEAPSELPRLEG